MVRLKKHPFRLFVVAMLSLASMVIFVSPAGAVHDAKLVELDTGATTGADLNEDAPNPPTDWETIFDDPDNSFCPGEVPATGAGNNIGTLPPGTLDTTFICDFTVGDINAGDSSYHEPSNHDQQNINPAGGSEVWGCGPAANPTDKNEILNVAALAARAEADDGAPASDDGDLMIYTVGERFDNSGTAFFGAWFFQSQIGCSASKFTGQKTSGDILITIDFSSGGSDVHVQAQKWFRCDQGPSPLPANKCKSPTTNAGYFQGVGNGADCGAAVASDNLCATVNRQKIDPTEWTTQDKDLPANQLDVSEMFEAGFNVTDLFGGGTPGSEPCISSFMLETRSSDTLEGATLKDFALGDFDTCVDVPVHKYHDKNADGVKDANGADNILGGAGAADDEVGLPGWTIFVDKGTTPDGLHDANGADNILGNADDEVSEVTDASGNATFEDFQGGQTLKLCETLLSGWINSDPGGGVPGNPDGGAAGSQPTRLCKTKVVGTAGVTQFGNYQVASKSGIKFQDFDGNGTKGTSEPILGGVWIHLFGTDGYGNTVHRHAQTSATTGGYSFPNLVPGSYTVCESIPDGFSQTLPSSGADCSTHAAGIGPGEPASPVPPAASGVGYSITLLSQDNDTNNDFGNAPLHKIIVLVCHQSSNTLVASSVQLGSGTPQTSLGSSATPDPLCSTTGAVFTNRPHGAQPGITVNIPSSGTGSGH